MNDQRRQHLVEQYENVAFSLLMDNCASEDGARLLMEFEKAQQSGNLPEIPAELDIKCKELIDRSFSRQERNALLTRIAKSLAKVAVLVLVFLGLSTVTIMSVDALRIPVLNFFLVNYGRYTSIYFDKPESSTSVQDNIVNTILAAPIPAEYQLVIQRTENDGSIFMRYEANEKHYISFLIVPSSGTLDVDTEDADLTEMMINGHKAIYIRNEAHCVIWTEEDTQLVYMVSATGLDADVFWELVYSISA